MTTVTTVEEANAKNRVMSIRKKFETLCHLEHLDISAPEIKREPKYLFQRSATTFNLSTALRRNHHQHGNHNSNKENGQTRLHFSSTAAAAGTGNNSGTSPGKCKSETLSLLRKSLRSNGQQQQKDNKLVVAMNENNKTKTKAATPPTTTINQTSTTTTPPKLMRQSSDPRRASIKRSPAFRVGETHQKIALAKSSSLNDCESLLPPQPNLTDTLRKALRQPLPLGPPPKKPPRLLPSPTTPTKPPLPIQEEEETTTTTPLIRSTSNNNKNSNGCWSKKPVPQPPTNGIKSNFNQIATPPPPAPTTPSPPPPPRPHNNHGATALLCCNNAANIYDDVASSCYYQETPRLAGDATMNNKQQTTRQKKEASAVVGVRKSEPIYMEPFQHLTMNLNNINSDGGTCKSEAATEAKEEHHRLARKPQVQKRRFSVDSQKNRNNNNNSDWRLGRSPESSRVAMMTNNRPGIRDKVAMMDVGEGAEDSNSDCEDYDEVDDEEDEDEEERLLDRRSSEDAKSVTGSIQTSCSCPEQHSAAVEKLQDLHYLVILTSLCFDRFVFGATWFEYNDNGDGILMILNSSVFWSVIW